MNKITRSFSGLVLLVGLFLTSGLTAFAIAPTGTMSMTSQSIATSSSGTANNTITVTAANTEILAANDLHIKIPDAVNAHWDTTDTSATYVFSGAGAANATVVLSNSNKTITIDITTNLDATSNIQVSGLKFQGDAASASGTLQWAVDNATVGSATFNSVASSAALTVTATDADATLVLADTNAGDFGIATLELNLSVALANTDTITFTAPAELDVSGLTAATNLTGTLEGGSGITCNDSGQIVTCTIDGASAAAANDLTIIFPASAVGISGASVGTTDITDLAVNDTSLSGADINSDATVAVTDIIVGDLTATNVAPESLSLSTISPTTFAFTTTAQVPSGAKIVVVYPAGWNLAGAAGQVGSALSGLTGTWTATVSSQTLTLTKTGGSADAAGAKSLTLNGIMTPPNEGSGGTYSITTTTSTPANIETDAAVTADTIIGKVASSIVVGSPTGVTVTDDTSGGVLITWVDPSGSGDATKDITILKGTAPMPVNGSQYALVLKGVQKYVDANVKAGDVVSYQLRASNGSGETGTTTAAVTFTVGSTVTGTTTDDTAADDTATDDTVVTDDTLAEDTVADDTVADDTTADDTTAEGTSADDAADADGTDVPFADIATHWAKDFITELYTAGVVKSATAFNPDNDITRGEFTKMVMEAFDIEKGSASTTAFSDVKNHWAAAYADGAKKAGLINGYSDGTFKPDAKISRAEAMKILLEATSYEKNAAASGFKDVKAGDWFAVYVNYAVRAKILSGFSDNTFRPLNNMTRGEVAKVIVKVLGM
ncbi:S-layer homology domain-containing protein [Candidatus Peregrinibacteria bacterium]|nr:S-layer homology domain-containing protein [Candidatus Peregrinibacteria bacterium]